MLSERAFSPTNIPKRPALAPRLEHVSLSSRNVALGAVPRGDVRAMPIKLVTVSKENSKGATLFAQEMLEKVQRYAPVTTITIKPNPRNSPDAAVQRETEGEKVLKALDSRDFVVVLDERGKELRSEDLAKLVAAAGEDGRPLAFCIGGPYGHSDAVRARADRMIRLSTMVLNHQVAVVVLLEQLYRSWTILRGVPYHH